MLKRVKIYFKQWVIKRKSYKIFECMCITFVIKLIIYKNLNFYFSSGGEREFLVQIEDVKSCFSYIIFKHL